MSYSLPKSLPRDDKAGIRAAIAALGSVGYKPWQWFDEDYATWADFEDGANVVDVITGVDDAEVMFEHTRNGNAFWVRFVMGNDPSEVICDHSYKDEGETGYDGYQAIDALINRWIEIESEAL